MAQVKVYRKDTGEIVYIPEHYLDHPVLGKPFRKTPTQKAREQQREEREAAEAALSAINQTSTERAGTAATPTPTDEPATPGDDN